MVVEQCREVSPGKFVSHLEVESLVPLAKVVRLAFDKPYTKISD